MQVLKIIHFVHAWSLLSVLISRGSVCMCDYVTHRLLLLHSRSASVHLSSVMKQQEIIRKYPFSKHPSFLPGLINPSRGCVFAGADEHALLSHNVTLYASFPLHERTLMCQDLFQVAPSIFPINTLPGREWLLHPVFKALFFLGGKRLK